MPPIYRYFQSRARTGRRRLLRASRRAYAVVVWLAHASPGKDVTLVATENGARAQGPAIDGRELILRKLHARSLAFRTQVRISYAAS